MLLRKICLILMLIYSAAIFAENNTTAAHENYFLTISDVHFDPFISCARSQPCPLIKKLQNAPVSEWPQLFAKDDLTPITYRQNTNYRLLTSALLAAKKVADEKNAQFVLVLGDFLGHDARRYYKRYAQDKSLAGYQNFVNKTYQFLANQFAQAFPNKDVYSVVGNNDSDVGDYYSNPQGAFFQNTANIWSQLIKNNVNRTSMRNQFVNAGYYALTIPQQPNLRLIVLNSVLFSHKSRGKGVDKAAELQLAWLHKQLELVKENHQKAIIAMHIPPGIDVYATLRIRLFRLIELWKPKYVEQFQADLAQFAPQIVGLFAGHLHSDWFQMITFSHSTDEIPATGTASVSPIFGNNPSFKIYGYLTDSLKIKDYRTYYYSITGQHGWGLEYDFSETYLSACHDCTLTDGIKRIKEDNHFAKYYQYFYAVSTENDPIFKHWKPYYWCAMSELKAPYYKKCIG